MSKHGWDGVESKLKKDYTSTVQAGWTFWFPGNTRLYYRLIEPHSASCLIYGFIPLEVRVIFGQMAALFWSTYISWKANLKSDRNSSDKTNTDTAATSDTEN